MDEPKKFILVGCGQQKQDRRCKAKNMYTSTLFKAARQYAELYGDYWMILSAKHHMLDPEKIIDPYEETLKGKGKDFIRRWVSFCNSGVYDFLHDKHPEHYERPKIIASGHYGQVVNLRVIILAGDMYVSPLRDKFPNMWGFSRLIETPLEGLQIGERIRWLQQRTGMSASAKEANPHGER